MTDQAWGVDADKRPDKPLTYDPDAKHSPQAGEQGAQPNLAPDRAVAGRRSNISPGATDDSPDNALR